MHEKSPSLKNSQLLLRCEYERYGIPFYRIYIKNKKKSSPISLSISMLRRGITGTLYLEYKSACPRNQVCVPPSLEPKGGGGQHSLAGGSNSDNRRENLTPCLLCGLLFTRKHQFSKAASNPLCTVPKYCRSVVEP
jgi:hypothetical protein